MGGKWSNYQNNLIILVFFIFLGTVCSDDKGGNNSQFRKRNNLNRLSNVKAAKVKLPGNIETLRTLANGLAMFFPPLKLRVAGNFCSGFVVSQNPSYHV